jgi:hypothetical protein
MSVPAVRPVPNLSGETRVGDTITAVAKDTKRVAAFTLAATTRIVKLSLACDGAGGAAPTLSALLRGVVYQGNVLLGMGDEVSVMSGDPVAWVDLPLLGANPAGVVGAAGAIEYGVLVGGDANVLRVAQIDPLPPGGRWNADVYAGGASDPFGTPTALTANMSIFATGSPLWAPREGVGMDMIARMGWDDAQRFLASAVLTTPTFDVTTTWHGTVVDANRGAFAVVRRGGPLAGLVGQRIRVSTPGNQPRSCLVYVWAAVPALEQDLSLARRAYFALDLLAKDTIDVHVEVLA